MAVLGILERSSSWAELAARQIEEHIGLDCKVKLEQRPEYMKWELMVLMTNGQYFRLYPEDIEPHTLRVAVELLEDEICDKYDDLTVGSYSSLHPPI